MSALIKVPIKTKDRDTDIDGIIPLVNADWNDSWMKIDPDAIAWCHPDEENSCVVAFKGCNQTTIIYLSGEEFCDLWASNR